MTFGLQTFKADGSPQIKVDTRLTRLIYTRFLPAAESSSVSVPNFNSANCVAVAVPRLPSLTAASSRVGHNISVSGSTVSWSPASASYRADSDLLVFAYQ